MCVAFNFHTTYAFLPLDSGDTDGRHTMAASTDVADLPGHRGSEEDEPVKVRTHRA